MWKRLLRGERRERKSTHLKEFCPARFLFGGKTYEALMVDSSRSGAQFGMSCAGEEFPMKKGQEAEYHIKTPYGESLVKGVVRWTETSSNHCQWGIQFTSLSTDESDPVVAYLMSPF